MEDSVTAPVLYDSYKLAGATRFKFVCELPELSDRQQFIDNLLDNFHSDIAEPAA